MSSEDGLFFDGSSEESFLPAGYQADQRKAPADVFVVSGAIVMIDLQTNRGTVKGWKQQSWVGLEDQFDALSIREGDGKAEYEEFLSRFFLLGASRRCFISYPSFNRELPADSPEDPGKPKFIHNIALRFEGAAGGDRDLVLMTDIKYYVREGRLYYIFVAKTVLLMDSNMRHYGETMVDGCSYLLLLGDTWTDGQADYTEITPEHLSKNVLNPNFIGMLRRTYVVSDPKSFESYIGDWREYIKSRRYIMEESAKITYPLAEIPDVFVAYMSDGKFDPEPFRPIRRLKDKDKNWTMEPVNGDSKPVAVIHICVDMSLAEYNSPSVQRRGTAKSRFDAFIKNPITIFDPKESDIDRRMLFELDLEDCLIGRESVCEDIDPDDEIEAINERIDREIEEKRGTQRDSITSRKEDLLSQYVNETVPRLVKEHIEREMPHIESRCRANLDRDRERKRKLLEDRVKNYERSIKENEEQISKQQPVLDQRRSELHRMTELLETDFSGDLNKKQKKEKNDLQGKITELRTKVRNLEVEIQRYTDRADAARTELSEVHRELEEPAEEADLSKAVAEMVSKEERIEASRLRSEKDQEIAARLLEEATRMFSEFKDSKDAEREAAIQKAKEEHSYRRLHAFFELDVPETTTPQVVVDQIVKRLRRGLVMRRNTFRDKLVLDRQSYSLDDLYAGRVMNPFLSTALFSPDAQGEAATPVTEIERFYQEKLNPSQRDAVSKALSSNGLFLIQGPPGTGKTQVIAEIATQLVMAGKKVLISSENNKAVDNAFTRLPKIPEIRSIRLFSEKSKKKTDNDFNIRSLTRNLYNSICGNLTKIIDDFDNRKKYEESIQKDLDGLRALRDQIRIYEGKMSVIRDNMSQIDADIAKENEKISRYESQNSEIEKKIEEKDEELYRVRRMEDGKTLDLIDAEPGVEKILAGVRSQPSVMRALLEVTVTEIYDDYEFYDKHRELFSLYAEKKRLTGNELLRTVNRISEYESEKRVSLDDTKIIWMFSEIPDYDALVSAKRAIESAVEGRASEITVSRGKLKSILVDTEPFRQNVRNLKRKRLEWSENTIYSEYRNLKEDFRKRAKKIFRDLSLSTFNNEDEAIDLLEQAMGRMSRESVDDDVNLQKKQAYSKIVGYMSQDRQIEKDSDIYNPRLLRSANVFGITSSSSDRFSNDYNPKESISLRNMSIDVVIIDEVSKLAFGELLRPMLLGKTVILVGDHRQLPPMYPKLNEGDIARYDSSIISVEKEERYRSMIEEKSFFEELFKRTPECNRTMLTMQYRMHRDIMDIDNVFYGKQLECGCSDQEKEHYINITGPSGVRILSEENHVLFVDCRGLERQTSGSTSFYNELEMKVVERLLDLMNSNCTRDRDGIPIGEQGVKRRKDRRLSVGVICTYKEQARMINRRINGRKYNSFSGTRDEKLNVSSVDNFQGDERDIIILSMVRSTGASEFLQDYHRINVAISRARRLLVIVGNGNALKKMSVKIDGNQKKIYEEIINTIKNHDGYLSSETVLGGGGQ